MSKRSKIILGSILVLFAIALIWFGKKNRKNILQFETETPFKTSITKKTVATGKVTPLEEIEIKSAKFCYNDHTNRSSISRDHGKMAQSVFRTRATPWRIQ